MANTDDLRTGSRHLAPPGGMNDRVLLAKIRARWSDPDYMRRFEQRSGETPSGDQPLATDGRGQTNG